MSDIDYDERVPDTQNTVSDLRFCSTIGSITEWSGRRANDPGPGRHLQGGVDMAKRTCSVDGCMRIHYARGWCDLHYRQARSRGPLVPLVQPSRTEAFWAKVDRAGPADCWMWKGAVAGGTGYGSFRGAGAHRVAYELEVGPIPDGLHIDHLCRNRLCVNPAHLEPVTQAENNRRVTAALTHCKRGHEYTPENTYNNKGHRNCRLCRRERGRMGST